MPRSVYALVVSLSLAASACVMVEDDDIEVVELDSYEAQDLGDHAVVFEATIEAVAGQTFLFVGHTPNGEPIDSESVDLTIEGGQDLGTSVDLANIEQAVVAVSATVRVIIIVEGIGTSP